MPRVIHWSPLKIHACFPLHHCCQHLQVFRKARAVAPSIVFFDEIDALAGERGRYGTSLLSAPLQEVTSQKESCEINVTATVSCPLDEFSLPLRKPLGRLSAADRGVSALFAIPSAAVAHCPEMSAQSWLWFTLICDGCLSHNDALMSRRSKRSRRPAGLRCRTNRTVPVASAPTLCGFFATGKHRTQSCPGAF